MNVAKMGLQAFNLTLDFDERAVLEQNISYLTSTLEVSFCGDAYNNNKNIYKAP